MIDGYGGSFEALNGKEVVLRVLQDLPARLGMDILAEPKVYRAEANDKKDPGGWTGVVIIAESHISIHTFPARGFVSADVYTCKNGMDLELIKQYFRECFALTDMETNFVKRGTRYPAEDLYSK